MPGTLDTRSVAVLQSPGARLCFVSRAEPAVHSRPPPPWLGLMALLSILDLGHGWKDQVARKPRFAKSARTK